MFDFPLEICNLLSLSQLLAVWKPEKEFAPREQVDLGKGIEVTEVFPWPSPVSQEQLITHSKTEFSLEKEAVEGLKNEELQKKLDDEGKKKITKDISNLYIC